MTICVYIKKKKNNYFDGWIISKGRQRKILLQSSGELSVTFVNNLMINISISVSFKAKHIRNQSHALNSIILATSFSEANRSKY